MSRVGFNPRVEWFAGRLTLPEVLLVCPRGILPEEPAIKSPAAAGLDSDFYLTGTTAYPVAANRLQKVGIDVQTLATGGSVLFGIDFR